MSKELRWLESHDGKRIAYYVWNEVKKPKGMVQIIHGMAEHVARYEEFAKFLNRHGYIVFGDDHRGHGVTSQEDDSLGFIGRNGFEDIILDERLLSERMKTEYLGLPLIVLGHSFGSFITQAYIQRYSEDIQGAIISGSAKNDHGILGIAQLLAWLHMIFKGEKTPSPLLDKLSFGSYNKKIENPKTKMDWLSRDAAKVKQYNDDPLCGTIFSGSFYYAFIKGLKGLYKKEELYKITKLLPILVLSGDQDPVGLQGKDVKRLYEQYKALDIKRLSLRLYTKGRHEMLNETNRQEVYQDILKWLKEKKI